MQGKRLLLGLAASTLAIVAAPLAAKIVGSGLSSKKGWRLAAVGGVVVLGALLGRQFFTGDDADEGDA